jgi:hypothetical protein
MNPVAAIGTQSRSGARFETRPDFQTRMLRDGRLLPAGFSPRADGIVSHRDRLEVSDAGRDMDSRLSAVQGAAWLFTTA